MNGKERMMRKFVFAAVAVCFTIYMFGCAKKEASIEEYQEPISIEQLSEKAQTPAAEVTLPAAEPLPADTRTPQAGSGSKAVKLEPLPPAGPYKPAITEIQTALKNAGFYQGAVDGKKGKMTEAAIKEFQKASGLEADGKVGPKTWAVLSRHLTAEPVVKNKKTR